jgi:hypothetical protein
MRNSSTIEAIDDITSDASDALYLTVADAARRLGIPRATLDNDIAQGRISAVTLKNGVSGIETSELLHTYIDGGRADTRSISNPSCAGDESRITQLEAELLLTNEHAKLLETQLAAIKETETRQEREIDHLRGQQIPNLPGADAEHRNRSSSRYYGRKRRSKFRKLHRRALRVIGVASLVIAVTGILVGFLYLLDLSGQPSEQTQSSRY